MTSIIRQFMLALLAASFGFATGASAERWGCYANKPGHPTVDEKKAFIEEASQLAVKAEKTYGVPAGVLVALAIQESGYGWTRAAIEANNLFGWRFAPSAAAEDRESFTPACERRRGKKDRYVVFKNRADAMDFVAGKLATLDAYRQYSNAYRTARARGEPAEQAAKTWLDGIARRYSHKPAAFISKITRLMNNPIEPSDVVAPDINLHRLSTGVALK